MKLKESLTKKVGPLPIWIWAIIALLLVWYYRNKLSGGGTLSTSAVTPADATQQQSPVVLGPGESVYDPNTGQLSSAPGDTGGSTGGDLATAMEDLAAAMEASLTQGGNNGSGGSGGGGAGASGGKNHSHTGSGTHSHPAVGSPAGKHGAKVAPYGSHRPKPKKGYATVGTGKGRWIYKPLSRQPGSKRTAKGTRTTHKKGKK